MFEFRGICSTGVVFGRICGVWEQISNQPRWEWFASKQVLFWGQTHCILSVRVFARVARIAGVTR
jgi:hypothetical protein